MLGNFREGRGSNFQGFVDTGTQVPSYLVLCWEEVLRFSPRSLDRIHNEKETNMTQWMGPFRPIQSTVILPYERYITFAYTFLYAVPEGILPTSGRATGRETPLQQAPLPPSL